MIEKLISEVEALRIYETGDYGYGHTTAIDRVIELLQSKLVEDEPKDVERTKALRQLMEEAYGALGWLQGSFQLSDRARAYKVKKLQKALAEAEVCLQSLALDEPTAKEVEQTAWAFWTERIKALLVEEGILLKEPDGSPLYKKQMRALRKIYLKGQAPEIAVSELLRGRRLVESVGALVKEVSQDVKQS